MVKSKAFMVWLSCAVVLFTSPAPPGALAQTEEDKRTEGIEARGNTVKINFPEMDLESVLKNFSAIIRQNFVLESIPKGQVKTIGPIGPVEVPKDHAFNMFVLILNLNGYDVVETSVPDVYKVIRTAEAIRENIPLYAPGEATEVSEHMITKFIPLEHVSANDIANQLNKLSSKAGGQVFAYEPTNTLIVVDTALNIKRMQKILELLDVPSPEPEIEIIILRNSEPGEMAGVLEQIFSGTETGQPARRATTKPQRRGRGKKPPAKQQPATYTAVEIKPKIIPVERLNGLVLIADAETLAAMKDIINELDVDVGTTGTIHVYYVQNAEAGELASILSGLMGKGTGAPGAPAEGPEQGEKRTSRPPRRTSPQTRTSRGAPSSTIPGVTGEEIFITSDEATNSLIIVATPHDYEVLKQVIAKLDIPRRQVFVEAVLLEVTYNQSMEAGVSMHGASPLEHEGMVFSGTGFSDTSSISLLSSLLSGGGSLALPNGITVGALAQPLEVPGTDGQVVIPSAGMVVRLLSSSSNVNVLSTPTLLTTDNEEASIEVGQKIPVPTGQTVSTGGFSNISISRESVGIKLQVVPQINESDNIRMEIFTEISGAVSSPLGIDVNTLGVTTSIKTAETTVIVKDSQTIVIGGLMEDRQDQSESRIPLLGDIPVLGWLFKSGRRSQNKTNLIIMLTPHIVRSESDIIRVKGHLIEGYQQMMEETLGDEAPDRDRYFDSRLTEEQEPVIDMRSGEPEMIEPPEMEWTPETPGPEQGDTLGNEEVEAEEQGDEEPGIEEQEEEEQGDAGDQE